MIRLLFFLIFVSCDFTPPLTREILKAQNFITQQKYNDAANEYIKILKKKPPTTLEVKIHYQLGDLYSIYLDEYKSALHHYRKVLFISKDPLWLVKTQERLGEVYFNFLKNYKESAGLYLQLSSFKPILNNHETYLFRLSLSYYHLREMSEAIKLFNKISANKNSRYSTRAIYYSALCYFEQKKWKEAITYLEKYIRLEKRKDYVIEAKFLMANSYESMELLKNAYNIYYSILGDYPNTQVIQNRLNGIYSRRIARKR